MAEQTPTARSLNYSLRGDILSRVKGATKSAADVKLQKLSGTAGIIDSIAGQAIGVTSSLISGKAKTKELEKGWGEVLSTAPEDWGTVEAMENFKTSVSSSQEEYIACVRSGDKKCQERLLAELGSSVKGLQSIKDATIALNTAADTVGLLTDEGIRSRNTQEEDLLIGQNRNGFRSVNGKTVMVIDNTENISERITETMTNTSVEAGEEDLLELFPEGETARYLEFPNEEVEEASFEDDLQTWKDSGDDPRLRSGRGDRPKRKDSKYTEKEEKPPLTTEEIRAMIEENPAEFAMKLANGDIKIKMDVNAKQIEERTRTAAVPTAIIDQVKSTLRKVRDEASGTTPPHFYPEDVRDYWASGFTKQDQNVMMTAEIGFGDGVTFEKDFMQSGELDIPIPIVALPDAKFTPVDTDGSGAFERSELMYDHDNNKDTPPIMYTLTKEDKKAVFKAMKEPENFDVAKQHFSEWATMRTAEVHNRGVQQKFAQGGGDPSKRTLEKVRLGGVTPIETAKPVTEAADLIEQTINPLVDDMRVVKPLTGAEEQVAARTIRKDTPTKKPREEALSELRSTVYYGKDVKSLKKRFQRQAKSIGMSEVDIKNLFTSGDAIVTKSPDGKYTVRLKTSEDKDLPSPSPVV